MQMHKRKWRMLAPLTAVLVTVMVNIGGTKDE